MGVYQPGHFPEFQVSGFPALRKDRGSVWGCTKESEDERSQPIERRLRLNGSPENR